MTKQANIAMQPAIQFSPELGPYRNLPEASACLCDFVDQVCGPGLGVAWVASGRLWPLRPARRDASGFGQIIVFEWQWTPPSRSLPRSDGVADRVARLVEGALTQIGEAQLARSQAELTMSQTLTQTIGGLSFRHRDDAAGVALDVLCITLSIGALATGVGTLGVFALVGGAFLLGADGAAYGFELGGHDGVSEEIKRKTEILRLAATIMTLPDAAWGGLKAIREFREIRELRGASRSTALAGETLASRTANTARALQYNQIAERARLRAQIRAEQLRGLFLHELTPRATAPASLYLLLRDELDPGNRSVIAIFLQRLTFHVMTVHS